jgi:hypothetical protein
MSLEQIAQRICKANGIDYQALSDSQKQTFLSQAFMARMLQTLTRKGGSFREASPAYD